MGFFVKQLTSVKNHKAPFPKWLFYALLCLFWWGVWGFLAKLGADQMTAMQVQVLFTLGLLFFVVLAAHERLGARLALSRGARVRGGEA